MTFSKAEFESIPPNERRKMVARDVIDNLSAMDVGGGGYCLLYFQSKPETASLQEALPLATKCTVCALGGLLISHVRLFNQVSIIAHIESSWTEDFMYHGHSGARIREELAPYFSLEHLKSIEVAFEGYEGFDYDASAWVRALPDPSQRLRAICENIIANNGDFDFDQVPSNQVSSNG